MGYLVEIEGLYYEMFTDVPFTEVVDEGLSRGEFRNGKREGPWVAYHDNGRLSYKGAFKDGKRDGPWIQYREDGTKYGNDSGTYRNDVRVSD